MNDSTALVPQSVALTADRSPVQPAVLYLANLSPGSRRTMTQSLAAITDILLARSSAKDAAENERRVSEFRWEDLRADHTAAIRARLVDLTSPGPEGEAPALSGATANKGLTALKRTLFEAWKLGAVDRESYERAISFEAIKGSRERKGRALSAKEALKLAISCEEDSTPLGARDGAIVAILLFAGLRRFELSALEVSDWNAEEGELTVRYGKGNKSRVVPVPDGVGVALDRWLTVRNSLLADRDLATTKIIIGLSRAHKARTPALTTDAIFKALFQRALRAGVDSFTPHDLRRTYIGDLLDAGADLSTAQQLAGHSDPKVTAGYDRRQKGVRQAAARRLNAPFTKRL